MFSGEVPTAQPVYDGGENKFQLPGALVIDSYGNAWVTNQNGRSVQKVTFANGVPTAEAPYISASPLAMDNPTGMAMDLDGNL